MLSCSLRLTGLALVLALVSCGYTPALKEDSPASAVADGFVVSVAGGREGFILEEILMQRLTPSGGSERHRLTARLEIAERNDAVPGAGGIDRKALDGAAYFEIRGNEDDTPVLTGSVTGTASYSSGAGAVADGAARRDAEKRLLTQIADRLYARLIITADEWAE